MAASDNSPTPTAVRRTIRLRVTTKAKPCRLAKGRDLRLRYVVFMVVSSLGDLYRSGGRLKNFAVDLSVALRERPDVFRNPIP
jgi:hypothetical protein